MSCSTSLNLCFYSAWISLPGLLFLCAKERRCCLHSIDLLLIWLSLTPYVFFLAQRRSFKNSVRHWARDGKPCGFKSRSPGPSLCLQQLLPTEGRCRARPGTLSSTVGLQQRHPALHTAMLVLAPAVPAQPGRWMQLGRQDPALGPGLQMAPPWCSCGAAVPAYAAKGTSVSPWRWEERGASLKQL